MMPPPFSTHSTRVWRNRCSTTSLSAPSFLKPGFSRSASVGEIQAFELLFIMMASNCLMLSVRYIERSSLTTGSNAPVFFPSASMAAVP